MDRREYNSWSRSETLYKGESPLFTAEQLGLLSGKFPSFSETKQLALMQINLLKHTESIN
jgi:hypothetical protein